MARSFNPVDINVGKRLRKRRVELGMTQLAIGEILGLSFQQIQKYESGANRVSASRLFDISKSLDVEVGYFFCGVEGVAIDGALNLPETDDSKIMSGREALELLRSYASIKDSNIRKNARAFMASIAQSEINCKN